jgi:caffeoyl-CoA O-methyltransferase
VAPAMREVFRQTAPDFALDNFQTMQQAVDASNFSRRLLANIFDGPGVAERIHIGLGDALEQLAQRQREFDIIFNDVDKEYYPRVLDLVPNHLRSGGLFITDNVLWYGRVTESDSKDETTRAIQEFNQRLYAMKDFFTTILPLRDGLAVAVKA